MSYNKPLLSGAFLIPYVIMMVLLGLPLFLIELGIGQRLRTGPMGVWNAIHPYLGGKSSSSNGDTVAPVS